MPPRGSNAVDPGLPPLPIHVPGSRAERTPVAVVDLRCFALAACSDAVRARVCEAEPSVMRAVSRIPSSVLVSRLLGDLARRRDGAVGGGDLFPGVRRRVVSPVGVAISIRLVLLRRRRSW